MMALVAKRRDDDDAPQSARQPKLDCLPFVDAAPQDAELSKVKALIAAAAAELPRDRSAYLQATAPEEATEPRTAARFTPQPGRDTSQVRERIELGVRFGGAGWRERCALGDSAHNALRRHAEARRAVLHGIHKRRADAQRRGGKRVGTLRRRFARAVRENTRTGSWLREVMIARVSRAP